jgi:hypothetical protein
MLLPLAICGQSASNGFGQESLSNKLAAVQIKPPFAWNRADRYEPPNFDAFFPDDAEAGKQLDQWLEGKLTDLSVDERLALIRCGLRNTSHYRTTLLGSLGNQFIWNKDSQDPRAIELMYHASTAPNPEVAHYALYHGPTVVSQRTPNLVRMLMEQYQSFDREIQHRIAWGMKTYGDKEVTRKLLLDLLDAHQNLDAVTVASTLVTYEAVFDRVPPEMDRFKDLAEWVIVFHRIDLSSDHPRAAEILRSAVVDALRDQKEKLIDFVTRVDGKYESAVVLVKGVAARNRLSTNLSPRVKYRITRNEVFSPRTLQECRLREFTRHLPGGLPQRALPEYTRPPAVASYAHRADELRAPDFEAFFADDLEAAAKLDALFDNRESLELTDRQLLELFRRGMRRSAHAPNELFGWIAGALGWPNDPLLTEIFYQTLDPKAPLKVRDAGIYYGFGLGTAKTKNILRALYRVYMAPPFDRSTNGNMRSRILWGVRDHEDDKHFLTTQFERALQDHTSLSNEALRQADIAYHELTGREPPNASDYASRGHYLVVAVDGDSKSIDESKRQIQERIGNSQHMVDMKFAAGEDEDILVMSVVRGTAGMQWLVEALQAEPQLPIVYADLLTAEIINQAENDILREFEKHLTAE